MQKQYPEVHSLEESLAILKKYKDDLTKEQYENIKSNIGTHAIESIYCNELTIQLLVKKNVYGLSDDEILAEYKEKGFVEYTKNCHRSLQS
ncbi:hypothetical protein F0965_02615 [Campylobacter coli]|uniref:Uncharacterized protein n=1 Tax=Campylobacter coli TaxID=195 RepID=A0A644SBC4_CAMCO|nr:hypothetical protein [Campylobacter coli]EAH8157427.1 hypothetical protein [Campylobacter coli]EAJ0099183.1 hypothetical protein [Campylobacter coli]ECR0826286.1 hypothetical protein [Campylobacter coli]ECR9545123.1 hypothetical protein [Campylobacter coli]